MMQVKGNFNKEMHMVTMEEMCNELMKDSHLKRKFFQAGGMKGKYMLKPKMHLKMTDPDENHKMRQRGRINIENVMDMNMVREPKMVMVEEEPEE